VPWEGIGCIDDCAREHRSRSLGMRIQRVARRCRKGQESDRGEQLYPGDNGAGVSSNGEGDNVDGEESIGLVWKLLPVT
jgi:hypothetical protein